MTAVYHDAHVTGVPTGALRRDELTAKGTTSRPPLLEDVLDRVKARIAVDLELKEPGYVEDVIGLLKAFGLDSCLLTSFLDDVVLEASALAPGLQTGLLVGIGSPRAPIRRLRRSRADYLGLDLRLADTTMLTRASAAGVPFVIWTVNNTPGFDRYLAHGAVKGVITDRPVLALERRSRLTERTARAAQR